MRRLWGLLKWIGFLIILLPSLPHNGEGQAPAIHIENIRPGMGPLVILEYGPLYEYEAWWREIAACENLPLPLKHYSTRFFALNVREYLYDQVWAIGNVAPEENQIYLAFPYIGVEAIVKHEMLHLLMEWNGEDRGHPYWRYGFKDIGTCRIFPYRRYGIDEK